MSADAIILDVNTEVKVLIICYYCGQPVDPTCPIKKHGFCSLPNPDSPQNKFKVNLEWTNLVKT
jgi:hypothetical protein